MKYVEHPSYDGLLTADDKRVDEYEEQYNTRGFDDSVIWSLDYSLVKWLLPRLKRFLEISENLVNADDFHADVKLMIEGFELFLDEDYDDYDETQVAKVDRSFQLLADNYKGLWW